MKSAKDLLVWQEAIQLVTEIYTITAKFPKEELRGLVEQMRRAAVSIPSNIAEGHDRNSDKEFTQFLSIAKGSTAELDTQIIIAAALGYIDEETSLKLTAECEGIRKRITALKATMQ